MHISQVKTIKMRALSKYMFKRIMALFSSMQRKKKFMNGHSVFLSVVQKRCLATSFPVASQTHDYDLRGLNRHHIIPRYTPRSPGIWGETLMFVMHNPFFAKKEWWLQFQCLLACAFDCLIFLLNYLLNIQSYPIYVLITFFEFSLQIRTIYLFWGKNQGFSSLLGNHS